MLRVRGIERCDDGDTGAKGLGRPCNSPLTSRPPQAGATGWLAEPLGLFSASACRYRTG